MIKKFEDYIKESINVNDVSFGIWVEKICGEDEEILSMVSQHIKNFDPSIRIANAVNVLDEDTKKFIYDIINNNKEEKMMESTTQPQTGGISLFKSFLKIITALGFKDIKPNWDKLPDDFITLFKTNMVPIEQLKNITIRYTFFNNFISKIGYTNNDCLLYFGVRVKEKQILFEYGISSETERIIIGKFNFTNSVMNKLMLVDSQSSANMKKMFIDYNYKNILLISKLKSILFSNKKPDKFVLNNGLVTISYYGEGTWSKRNIDNNSLLAFKQEFSNLLLNSKLADKFRMKITAENMWINIDLQIKNS